MKVQIDSVALSAEQAVPMEAAMQEVPMEAAEADTHPLVPTKESWTASDAQELSGSSTACAAPLQIHLEILQCHLGSCALFSMMALHYYTSQTWLEGTALFFFI